MSCDVPGGAIDGASPGGILSASCSVRSDA